MYLVFHILEASRNKSEQLPVRHVFGVASHARPKVIKSDIFDNFEWSYLENGKIFSTKIVHTCLLSGRLTTAKKLRVYSLGLLSYELPKIQAAIVSAMRGKVLSLKVKKSTNAKDLCEFATRKLQAHNSIGSWPFKLVYPNGSEVKQLPESKNDFSVAKYKAEIARPYQRLTLYLCNSLNLIESLMSFDSCESDIEDNSDH